MPICFYRVIENTRINDPIFFEKAILLPGPDRKYGGQFDYVVCRPDHLGRVDSDNEITRGFVIRVNNDMSKI